MSFEQLAVIALATFYAAYVISKSAGPLGVFAALRSRLKWGVFSCFICAAFWCALIFYGLSLTALQPIGYIFAAAGLALFGWRYTGAGNLA